MTYCLGVDLGTSYTAAAICRDGNLEMVSLGNRSMEIPSVVFLDVAGDLIVGESAERRGPSDPSRLAREYKRRLGDPAPLLLGGTPFSPEALMATVLTSVVADITARQGGAPAHVTLTRPANWGPYKQELFGQVATLASLGSASTASEPEAAAVHFASTTRVGVGQAVAVYDLGGGTFDAAVLRKTESDFATLGNPEGIEHLGGADFDDAVFEYVRRLLGAAFSALDPTDPGVRSAATRLRHECVLAKESLSLDTEATIPVAMPGLQTEVRITRNDFEDLVRPALMATMEPLRRAMRGAGVGPGDIAATVLAGGSSRIPLAAELITGELELPVAVGTHPKHTVALGAALLAQRHSMSSGIDGPTGRLDIGTVVAAPPQSSDEPAAPVVDRSDPERRSAEPGRRRRLLAAVGAAAVVLILVGVAIVSGVFRGESTAGVNTPGASTPGASTAAVSTTSAGTPHWTTLAPLPKAVEGAAVAAYDGKVWVAGGISNDASRSKLTTVFIYDPSARKWAVGPSLPEPISHAQLVATSWGLYFIGGYIQTGGSRDVLMLAKNQSAWVRQSIPLPGARVAGAAAFDGARIIFAGGTRPDGTAADEVWSSTGGAWTLVGRMAHGRQKLAAASNGDGRVWIMGGHDQQTGKKYGEVDVVSEGKMDPTASAAQTIDPPIDSAAAVRVEGAGRCLVGGETPSGFNSWWCDQPGTAAGLPPLQPARAGLGAAVIGTTVYIVGGYGDGFEGSDRVESFTPTG